ncbi:MAG: glycosyltransferase, partial [Bacteroidales bacterium]|nr:glycosyltransferase [Bacteroidales bacterium]
MVSVVISTYNQPRWLELVLYGYKYQTVRGFELIIADDGSDQSTRQVIERMRHRVDFPLIHVYHEDQGFRKCAILNKAILESSRDYLIFSDGDIIPRRDFIQVHLEMRQTGRFLSGGTVRLPGEISQM